MLWEWLRLVCFKNLLDTLAWAHHHLGRDAEARRILEQIVEGPAPPPAARYHLARIHHGQGERDAARAQLARVLADDTDFNERDEAEALARELDL